MTRQPSDNSSHSRTVTTAVAHVDEFETRRLTWLRLLAAFFAVAFAVLTAVHASGQNAKYDTLPVEQRLDDNLKLMQREAAAYATTRDLSAFEGRRENTARFYFERYVPAKITQPDAVPMITELMTDVRTLLERSVRSRAPGSRNLLTWSYKGLKPIAQGNYQPPARINAILFIANLAPQSQRGTVPRPYGFVLSDLLPIYLDESAPDGVRGAALYGIEKFVRYTPASEIDANLKTQLTDAMTQLLESPAPTGRDDLAHAYLQRYAVSILTNLKPDETLGKQLVSISTDENSLDLIALHSVAAIGNLAKNINADEVETDKVLQNWSARILKAYEEELARLKGMDKQQVARKQPPDPESFLQVKQEEDTTKRVMPGMGMEDSYGSEMEMMSQMDMMSEMDMGGESDMMSEMMMMGMSGMARPKPKQPPEILATRKRLNFIMEQVLRGVTGQGSLGEDPTAIEPKGGLYAATPPESADVVQEWLDSINTVFTGLNDDTIGTRPAFIRALETEVETLKALARGQIAVNAGLPGDDFNPLLQPAAPEADLAPPAAGNQPAAAGAQPPAAARQPNAAADVIEIDPTGGAIDN